MPAEHQLAFLIDLDGTLIDNVYHHVLAWKEALEADGIRIPVWRLHRYLGMSGGLFIQALLHEIKREMGSDEQMQLRLSYREAYKKLAHTVCLLPGAQELLDYLTDMRIPCSIVTSATEATVQQRITLLNVPKEVPVVTRDLVEFAKPDPDLFLAAADTLKVGPQDCVVIGDSVWDLLAARRAGALGIGLLSGGYGFDELHSAGAYRVYKDPADMLNQIYEIGIRSRH